MSKKNSRPPSFQNQGTQMLHEPRDLPLFKKWPADLKTLQEEIFEDLELTFQKALEDGHYTAAIRAKELQLKELNRATETVQQQIKKISEMTEEELRQLL